ncbi:FapA family protein [Photobacterium sp.]|uniref:DUF342 domain-containing protein n=1 Tax=Photobacterium sp. TaxID=660 RepID=UPI00299E3C7E|nr:FapA family protein [Photobacterium sp.]MDX1303103.1 FapA family protein [Photobacterium sp.]
MSQQLLQLSQDGHSISILVRPQQGSEMEIKRVDIYAAIADHQASHFFLFENAIESALEILNSPVSDDTTIEPTSLLIAEKRDAMLLVKTEADLMTASITVVGAYGGEPVAGNTLVKALKEHHIIKGIRKNQLQELLSTAHELEPGEKFTLPVAFGRLPENGLDSQFEPLVEDASHRVLQPQATDDGRVDMRNLGEMVTVKASEAIMRRIPATQGVSGFNVIGNELAAVPGKEITFDVGEGTEISDTNENLLVASKAGMPIIKGNGMQVDDALILKGVNVNTGHVNFDGCVVINGDVMPGMKVIATGSITITGVVELAELRAGGDIVVADGLIGRQQQKDKDLTCYIKSGGKVSAKFAQYVEIDAGQDVAFSLHALHCQIRTQGEVIVCDSSKRHGTLSGGTIHAGYSVKAVNIGATAGTQTEITAFNNYHVLRRQLADTYKSLEHHREKMEKIHVAQQKLLKIPQSKRPAELVQKVIDTRTRHIEKIKSLKAHYTCLKSEYDELRRAVSITAFNHLYTGVNCRLEKLVMNVSQEHGPCKIIYKEQLLELSPL